MTKEYISGPEIWQHKKCTNDKHFCK